ncbi:MAG: Fic family protein [Syntrophomonas sp.]|nr:Fic family protein [Syntrophomonas sp.]
MLINKENIKNAQDLAKYESDITMLRQYELEHENRIKGRFGAAHLKNIHKYIFQDIYPFAGKFRFEDMWKDETFFCKSEHIEENLTKLLAGLKKENYLRKLDLEVFSARIAYYMSQMNMIHPFREGNGRAIREFIRQLALQAGYRIDWSKVEPEILLKASIISVDKDLEPLSRCIIKATVKQ